MTTAPLDPDVALEAAHFVENLDAVRLTIADIYQAIVAELHTVDHLHENTGLTGFRLCARALPSPLTQEFAGSIKYRDAAVSVAIGNINIAVGRIDRDIGRHEELSVTRVKCPSFQCSIGGIHHDLQK